MSTEQGEQYDNQLFINGRQFYASHKQSQGTDNNQTIYAQSIVNHNSSNFIQNPNIVSEHSPRKRNEYNLEAGKASTKLLSIAQEHSKSSANMNQ